MARSLARPGGQKELSKAEAQSRVIDMIQEGYKVEEACKAVGRSQETYRDWMKEPEFKATVLGIR